MRYFSARMDLMTTAPVENPNRDCSSKSNVSLNGVPVVGDSLRDLECAQAVGARPALVRTGKGKRTEDQLPEALKGVAVFDDLAAFTEALLHGGLDPLIAPISSDS